MSSKKIRSLINQDKFQEALNVCDEILRVNPNDSTVIILKAQILAMPIPEISNPTLSAKLLIDFLKKDSFNADMHEALGQTYEHGLGDYHLAMEEYKKTIELEPKRAGAYYALADLYQHPGVLMTTKESLEYLKKAVFYAPSSWEIRRSLGTRLWESENYDKAILEFETALKCVPGPDEYSSNQIKEWIKRLQDRVSYKDGYIAALQK